MLRSFLRSRAVEDESFARAANLYIARDRKTAVAAVVNANDAGIYYESPGKAIAFDDPSELSVGQRFLEAFAQSSSRDIDLSDRKKSDWPAFLAAGTENIGIFERKYVRINCLSMNNDNVIVRAEIAHPDDADINLSICFNPKASAEDIGSLLFKLFTTANK